MSYDVQCYLTCDVGSDGPEHPECRERILAILNAFEENLRRSGMKYVLDARDVGAGKNLKSSVWGGGADQPETA